MRHDKKKVWSNILDLFFATEIYIFIYEFFFIISLLYFGFSFITRERERLKFLECFASGRHHVWFLLDTSTRESQVHIYWCAFWISTT